MYKLMSEKARYILLRLPLGIFETIHTNEKYCDARCKGRGRQMYRAHSHLHAKRVAKNSFSVYVQMCVCVWLKEEDGKNDDDDNDQVEGNLLQKVEYEGVFNAIRKSIEMKRAR